jgi:hypothetical protein
VRRTTVGGFHSGLSEGSSSSVRRAPPPDPTERSASVARPGRRCSPPAFTKRAHGFIAGTPPDRTGAQFRGVPGRMSTT